MEQTDPEVRRSRLQLSSRSYLSDTSHSFSWVCGETDLLVRSNKASSREADFPHVEPKTDLLVRRKA
jgi:hypothetical protein